MFQTSHDLLNLAMAVAILGLSALVGLAIFYFAMIMRQTFRIVKEMRNRLAKIDELIKSIQEKIEHSASYLLLIGEGVKKLVEVIKERTGEPAEGKKRKKKIVDN
jgi:predicted PurR-regulated permease PerM